MLCAVSGECVLALKSAFSVQPQLFITVLTHVGEETGTVRSVVVLYHYINCCDSRCNSKGKGKRGFV